MLFVQPPGLLHRNPILVKTVQHTVQRLHGTLQIGRVSLLKMKAFLLQQLTRLYGLGNPFFRQVNVRPARKTVFFIPNALAVAEQNNSFHLIISFWFAIETLTCLRLFT